MAVRQQTGSIPAPFGGWKTVMQRLAMISAGFGALCSGTGLQALYRNVPGGGADLFFNALMALTASY